MRTRTAVLLCSLPLLLALPAAAAAQGVDVLMISPKKGEPVFGQVELAWEILSAEPIDRVEVFVDGQPMGELTRPPWRLVVDVGDDNVEHRFLARAHTESGSVGESVYISPAFRVDEELDAALRPVYVTALDGDRRVLDLDRGDFEVYDGGRRQELTNFSRGDAEIAAALLVDASVSMRGHRLRFALRGAAAFALGLSEIDEAALYLFSDRLLHATPFTSDRRELLGGLDGVDATGGTALNDHLYLALKRLEERKGRRVLILLSDGVDSHSALAMRDVAWLARRSRALIYWVRTDPRQGEGQRFSAWKGAEEYVAEEELLSKTVTETGGRIITLDRIEEAEAAMRGILQELREQYVLGYYPSEIRHDGGWREVDVRVSRPGVRLRHRDGYIDY